MASDDIKNVINRDTDANKVTDPLEEGYVHSGTDTGLLQRRGSSAWEFLSRVVGGLLYKFSTTTSDADPGAGTLRFNNATPASVTVVYIDDSPLNVSADLGAAFDNMVGNRILIYQLDTPANYILGDVSADTDGTGYWKLTVSIDDSGSLPDDGALLGVVILSEVGSGGGGGAHASDHIDGGSDAIDGDKLEISWVPARYTRDSSTPSEADSDDDLTAHLQGIDNLLQQLLALVYQFSTTTTDGDPGTGVLRFNNATPGSVTKLFLDDVSESSDADLGTLLAKLVGARILIQQIGSAAKYLLVQVDGATDDTGYWDLDVTVEASGTLPDDGAKLALFIVFASDHVHAAGDITSGTMDDARIAESNVTQHEGAIDHDALTNYAANEHMKMAADVIGSRPAAGTFGVGFYFATDTGRFSYSTGSAWVELDADTLDGSEGTAFAAASHSHAASDVTSGTFDDARVAESNVTQHEGAIDHDALTNFEADEHVKITTGTSGARPAASTHGVGFYFATDTARFSYSNATAWTELDADTVDGSEAAAFAAASHASAHERGGADEIDGDHLDIDFTPSNYTPSTSPSEAADVDDLAAHLAGIDDELAGGAAADGAPLTSTFDGASTTDGDAGTGYFRADNGTPASITKLFIPDDAFSNCDIDFGDLSDTFVGSSLLIVQKSDASRYLLLEVQSATDDTGYWDMAVAVLAAGSALEDEEECLFYVMAGVNTLRLVEIGTATNAENDESTTSSTPVDFYDDTDDCLIESLDADKTYLLFCRIGYQARVDGSTSTVYVGGVRVQFQFDSGSTNGTLNRNDLYTGYSSSNFIWLEDNTFHAATFTGTTSVRGVLQGQIDSGTLKLRHLRFLWILLEVG